MDHPLSPESAPFRAVLPDFSLEKSTNTRKNDIDSMNQAELLDLHAKIEQKLMGIRLSDINLEKETLIQFHRAKLLQEKANKARDVPVNQLAQVQNSLRNTLETLAKMQMELHDSETIKRWKAALIRVVKAQPKEFQTAFFELLDTAAAETELLLQQSTASEEEVAMDEEQA